MHINIDELLDKAYDGRIYPEELAEVVNRIQKYYEFPSNEEVDLTDRNEGIRVLTQVDGDIHSLLQIVGYAGCFCYDSIEIRSEYRALIEKFIVFPRDPLVSVTAFCVLCNDWDLTAEYLSQIKMYMRGVEWDEDEDVRVKAMCIAGSYIKETGDKELLRMLLEIFENDGEEKIMREIAYDRISIALGGEWTVLRQIDMDTFPQNLVAQETIVKAHKLLATE